jgi:Kef-type K+ transport system membrane component KefB
MLDSAQEPVVHLSLLVRFAIIMATLMLMPPLCRRLRLPSIVGLLLAGVALGHVSADTRSHNAP